MQNGPYLALPCGLISARGSGSKGFCSIPSGLRLLVGGRGEDLFLPVGKPGELQFYEGRLRNHSTLRLAFSQVLERTLYNG